MAASSFRADAWRRLKKNKGAVFGMIMIGLALLIALTAYLIAPDPTPNANRIIVEIAAQRPGFTMSFLLLPKDIKKETPSFLSRIFFGRDDDYNYIPINSYEQRSDSLVIYRFIDEAVQERQSFWMPALKQRVDGLNEPWLIRKKTFWLGTDRYGRDILSRLIVGVRVSLAVGLITVIISLSIGVILGSLAGYFRGVTDEVIMWFVNVIWSIPTLLLVFAITLILGKGFWQVFIAIGLTMWVSVARIIRGQILSVRELEFVLAAKALGFSDWRIITRHILPNVLGPVLVVAASNFASAIVIEAGLSFLGVGVQPPQPSWGLMIKENYNFIITHNPALALAPGVAIMLLVLAFNLVGNGLRDALQVRN